MRTSQITSNRQNVEEQEQIEDIKGQTQRVDYLRRVYALLFAQLAFAYFLIWRTEVSTSFRSWVLENSGLTYWTSLIVFLLLQVLLIILPQFYGKNPFNWLSYVVNSLAFGFLATYFDLTQTNGLDLVQTFLRIALFGVAGLVAHAFTIKFEITFQQTSFFLLGGLYSGVLYSLIFTSIPQFWALIFSIIIAIDLYLLVWNYETIFSNNFGNFQNKDVFYGASSVYVNIVQSILRGSELLKDVVISGPKTA